MGLCGNFTLFGIAPDDLFDCGEHHITTMKGQVITNRSVKVLELCDCC